MRLFECYAPAYRWICFKKAAKSLLIRVPFATTDQSLDTTFPVSWFSQRLRFTCMKTSLPRKGKSWNVISEWNPFDSIFWVEYSSGAWFNSSRYKWIFSSSNLWFFNSKNDCTPSGNTKFKIMFNDSCIFKMQISYLFSLPHKFWTWSLPASEISASLQSRYGTLPLAQLSSQTKKAIRHGWLCVCSPNWRKLQL